MKAQKVQSKTVLVTGCSSGIGEGIANYLRSDGWDVFPTARSELDLEKLRSVGFEALSLDLCCSNSIQDCISGLLSKCPAGIGAIVNNAGIAVIDAIQTLCPKPIKRKLSVLSFAYSMVQIHLSLVGKLVILPTLTKAGFSTILRSYSAL